MSTRIQTILFLFFFSFINSGIAQSFTTPDTVCVNTPVNITNTTVGASTYYWNFCVADVNQAPVGNNLGNPGNLLNGPVYMDYVFENGNYYGFVSNNYDGNLIRLDFGNSLLNTPVATNLGTIGGVLAKTNEGIQVVKNAGKWYVFVVGGDNVNTNVPCFLAKIELGTSITNNSPTAVNWGNLGNMSYPHALYMFSDNSGNWFGLTINTYNNTITKFSFGTDLSAKPIGINLGNIGNLNTPTGVHFLNDNNNWYAFITNAGSGTDASITRLDFGNSLANTPTGVNIGSLGNVFNKAWDIYVLNTCTAKTALVINAGNNTLTKLDFGGSFTNIPTTTSLPNIGNMNFPHSLSKIFRVGANLFTFVTNVTNNTITSLMFQGCTNASIPNSSLQNPAALTYSTPGIYNINLTIDDGLPTQASFCRHVTVVPSPIKKPIQTFPFCIGDSLILKTDFPKGFYVWNTGVTDSSIKVKSSLAAWVEVAYYGCTVRDSTITIQNPLPVVNLGNDTTICSNDSLILNAGNYMSVKWNDGNTTPTRIIKTAGQYSVNVAEANGCKNADTIIVNVKQAPVLNLINKDTTVCLGQSVMLNATGSGTYNWTPAKWLTTTTGNNPIASPLISTRYIVQLTNVNDCSTKDSLLITVHTKSNYFLSRNKEICIGDSINLTAAGGDTYQWKPATSVTSANTATTIAFPSVTTLYTVFYTDSICRSVDSLVTIVTVYPKPAISIVKSNDLDCFTSSAAFFAYGGATYHWQPSTGLSNAYISNPIVNTNQTSKYFVTATSAYGCSETDSVTVYFNKGTVENQYLMPSAFTPNGDGLNDCFGIKNWGYITELQFSIFNRFGERVFYTNNPADCWNGYYKGILQQPGTFVYYINAKTICGNAERRGTVVLIR
ncbi:gliding motility-associated C-terminal domain-containing protein [Chitinophagaceae bacterium LWZ2-11]